ncbi:hypothetical protein AVEN_275217-1 [Araneus ventricosus]|uniref:Uncharacterized protein n=1 Tax=Araneus ventricosus TaxID=182803 RepID=A0A4Y2TIC4_ARAVE|nr:hypothetical protein AVEN_275217-1 [Araneus ventricosus]
MVPKPGSIVSLGFKVLSAQGKQRMCFEYNGLMLGLNVNQDYLCYCFRRRHLIVTKGTVQIFLFNSIMEAIEKFKSKRKVVRTASTKLVNQITLLLESYDIKKEKDRKKLSEYLLNVEDKLKELKTLNKEIEELITDKAVFEADIETSFEYEEKNDLKF